MSVKAETVYLVIFTITIFVIVIVWVDGNKIKKTLKKPIEIVQKKTADNDLDKKLERLQKLGQLLKDGVITKEKFEAYTVSKDVTNSRVKSDRKESIMPFHYAELNTLF